MPSARRSTSLISLSSLAIVALLALGASACSDEGGGSNGDGGGESGETIGTVINDFSITLDPATATAGAMTFEITNDGPSEHEVEIFRGAADPASIEVESGVALLDDFELITEAENIVPGASASLSADLDAGEYLIVCNLPTHFEQGMYTAFTVE